MKLLMLVFIPILIHIICLLLGLWIKPGDLSMIEFVFDTIIVPIYLIVINYKLVTKVALPKIVGYLIFMMVVILAGHGIHYLNWGISTGYLTTPDSATVHLFQITVLISLVILIIGWIAVFVIKNKSM